MKFTNIIICIILFSTIILIIQPPFAFYSPDISYHASKILRSSEGDFFSDPFSGTLSIYHPFYHVFFGLILNLFLNNTLEVMWIAGLVIFCGFILSYVFLVNAITNDSELALVSVLVSSCLFYSPTGHSFILQNPSGFGLIFLLLGISFYYLFLVKKEGRILFFSFFLFGIATTIWWFYLIPFGVFFIPSLIIFSSKYHKKDLYLASIGFIVPNLFTLWHIYNISPMIPLYKVGGATINITDIFSRSLFSLITRGNFQFSNFIFPFNIESISHVGFFSLDISILYSFAASIQFFCIAIPVTLFVLISPFKKALQFILVTIRREIHYEDSNSKFIIPMSATIGYAIIIISSIIFIIGSGAQQQNINDAHLQRLQFVGLICILPAAIYSLKEYSEKFRKIFIIFGVISLVFSVLHTPAIGYASYEPTNATSEIIKLVKSNPEYQNNRIFLTEDNLRKVAPFTRINSYVGHRSGLYYSQDPVSSGLLYSQYSSILNGKMIIDPSFEVSTSQLFILNKNTADDIKIIKQFLNNSVIIHENSEWIILRVPFSVQNI